MKLILKALIILLILFNVGLAYALGEAPVKGFIYENLKDGKVKLTWHNAAQDTMPFTLVVGSDKNIDWKPARAKSYEIGQIGDDNIHILGKTDDRKFSFSTELVLDKGFKYYKAFCFDNNFNYSSGRNAANKMGLASRITIVGMLVVFIGLAALVGAIFLLGRGIELVARKHTKIKEKKAEAIAKTPASNLTEEKSDTIPPHIVAIISAVLASYMGSKQHKIKSIRREQSENWIKLSRLDAMTEQ